MYLGTNVNINENIALHTYLYHLMHVIFINQTITINKNNCKPIL